MTRRRRPGLLSQYFGMIGNLLPGDMIHDEAPISTQKDARVEMEVRDAAVLKRMRRQQKKRGKA